MREYELISFGEGEATRVSEFCWLASIYQPISETDSVLGQC